MKITYRKDIDAAYIYLIEIGGSKKNKKIVSSTDSFSIKDLVPFGDINIDFNENGKILGFEVLNASRYLPQDILDEAEQL